MLAEIVGLLIGLTNARKNWGFGLYFLYLRNVQGRPWNHKRVYRIYRALELNLRIKPRRRLRRDQPKVLAVPVAPNVLWSMDFMADRLGDGRAFRLLNVLDNFKEPTRPTTRSRFPRFWKSSPTPVYLTSPSRR
jgi:putative transposase